MSRDRAEAAPLFTDSFSLADWVLGRLGRERSVLARTLCREALALLDHVLLALKGHDREPNLDEADRVLLVLRVHLRLAASSGELTEEQALHALDIGRRIGRQLGGWQRSLEAA